MTLKTRRDFLRNFARAAAAAALAREPLLWSRPIESQRPVRAWVTSGKQRFEGFEAPRWQKAAASASLDIRIDSASKRQAVLGFGAAFTDAACYLFSQLPAQGRQELIGEFFGPDGLRLSVARTCIGSSDYSRNVYSYDDTPEPDPELKHFSIEHDRAYILPSLRTARELNPELFLFSSPWSPPGWMKAGGSMLGGSMRKAYFAAYAQYFVRFLEAYAAEGVKINAVTIQNETDTDQDGRMPACLWGQEYEIEFVSQHLGPELERNNLSTKIWILDHNYNFGGGALGELKAPGLRKYADGIPCPPSVGPAPPMT